MDAKITIECVVIATVVIFFLAWALGTIQQQKIRAEEEEKKKQQQLEEEKKYHGKKGVISIRKISDHEERKEENKDKGTN